MWLVLLSKITTAKIGSPFVLFALFWYLDFTDYDPNFPYGWIEVYLPFILTVLNVASLVSLSYGIARWQGARDVGFTVLQMLVSGIVVYLISTIHPFDVIAHLAGSSVGYLYVVLAVALFAACVFLLRPACWKQQLLAVALPSFRV